MPKKKPKSSDQASSTSLPAVPGASDSADASPSAPLTSSASSLLPPRSPIRSGSPGKRAASPPSSRSVSMTAEHKRIELASRQTLLLLKGQCEPTPELPSISGSTAGSKNSKEEKVVKGKTKASKKGLGAAKQAAEAAAKDAEEAAAAASKESAANKRQSIIVRRMSSLGSLLGHTPKGPRMFTDEWSMTTRLPLAMWPGVTDTDEHRVRVTGLALTHCQLGGFLADAASWGPFLAQSVQFLTVLDLSGNPNIVGDIASLSVLANLTSLALVGCSGLSGTFSKFATQCPNLAYLNLRACTGIAGDVASLAGSPEFSPSLTFLDVAECPMVTELPFSWLLRVLKPCINSKKAPDVATGWPPWGADSKWRSAYDRLRPRPATGSYWLGKKFPELGLEWKMEEERRAEWPCVDFSKSEGLLDPSLPGGGFEAPREIGITGEGNGLGTFDGGMLPSSWDDKNNDGEMSLRSGVDSRGGGSASQVSFRVDAKSADGGRAPSRSKSPKKKQQGSTRESSTFTDNGGDGNDDSDGDSTSSGGYTMSDTESEPRRPNEKEARALSRAARRAARRAKRDTSTPSANITETLRGPPLITLGWILNLRLPNCGLALDLVELAPALLNGHVRSVDLSNNPKVTGDLVVVKRAHCERLHELLLHNTSVTGDYHSISREYCPELKLCLLAGTFAEGELKDLPSSLPSAE